jgi:1,4-alpha-glucan branching enzyme
MNKERQNILRAQEESGYGERYKAGRNLHRVNFFCAAPEAKSVYLVGDFNKWDGNATPMTRMPDGRWMATLEIRHGHHQYVFLVDGKPTLDPNATGKARNHQNEPVSLIAIS